MKTLVHSKRKIFIRSSLVFVLVLSIFFSSISISFASADAPYSVTDIDNLLSSAAVSWVADWLEQDPNSYVFVWSRYDSGYDETIFYVYVVSADVSLFFDYSNQNVAANSRYGFDGIWYSSLHPDLIYNNSVPYPGNSSFTDADNITWFYFSGLNVNPNRVYTFYCSEDFKDNGGDRSYNLDISSLVPSGPSFNAWLSTDKEFIFVEVDFNVETVPSTVTVWGEDNYGPSPYTYIPEQYMHTSFDMTDRIWSTFQLPTNVLYNYYSGTDFTVTGVSCKGWSDEHTESLTVDWSFSANPDLEYDPPDNTYYYSTFVNEYYSYNDSNGGFATFGFGQVRCSDNVNIPCFWDADKTLIQPYVYTLIALPLYNNNTSSINPTGQLTALLDYLTLSYDVILLDVPQTTFDRLYGSGAYNDWFSSVSGNGIIDKVSLWYSGHSLLLHSLPFAYVDNPPSYNSNQTCGFLYTDSFYFKSLSYIAGDTDDRLLEFSQRFFEEDGFSQKLLSGLTSIYDLQYTANSDILGFLAKQDYFINEVVVNDYFGGILSGLSTLNSTLNTIDSSISDVNSAINNFDLSSIQAALAQINESVLGLDLTVEDINLIFPEFNFDIIVENHPNTNIEYFVDFVNNFFTALPDADFSPLQNIETDFSDIFDDLHVDDSYDDFLDSLLDDFKFSDSHLDDYD